MRMRYVGLVSAAVALFGLAPFEATACRYNPQPAERIARGGYDAVVLTRVVRAAYTENPAADYGPWSGTVEVTRVLRGKPSARTFLIGRTGETSACDDGLPRPAAGDTWVLYLAGANASQTVLHSYPLAIAMASDPKLRATLGGAATLR